MLDNTEFPPGISDQIRNEMVLSEPSVFTEERRRLVALLAYAETRNQSFAARAAGIPPATLKRYLSEPGVEDDLTAMRDGIRMGMVARYTDLVLLGTKRAMERLEKGDVIMTKHGLVTIPVRARDAMAIAVAASERHAILTGNIAPAALADARLVELAQALVGAAEARAAQLSVGTAPLRALDAQTASILDVLPTEGDAESLGDDAQLDATLQQSIQ